MSKISHQKSYHSKNEKDGNDSIIKINSTLDKRSLYKILMKNPYLVNSVDSKKESILSYSIKNHNIQVANLILTSPILDLNYQDKDGNSYLHLAILYKEEEIVKSLIEKGISVFKQNKEGNTPLHLAYMKNDKRIIRILEETGIDTSAGTNKNKSVEDININLGKSQKSNNVDIIANNKSISQTKIKYYKNLNYNNDPNAKNKNITSNQTQKKLITSTKPNNITNRGNKLNYPIKLCNTIANLIQSKNKESVNLKYNKQFDINEDIISINEYKIKAHNINDNKKSENEKITKIDFETTNKNNIINNVKKNIESKKLNHSLEDKEKLNTFSFENNKDNLKKNKRFSSSMNTNQASPKPSKKNKAKKFINNKNRNIKKNNWLSNSIGANNNLCLNKGYPTNSEQTNLQNPINKLLFQNKIDVSSSTKKSSHFDESKLKTIVPKNDNINFIDIIENNTLNKNKKDNINNNNNKVLVSNNTNTKKNKVENNSNKKKLNTNEPIKTESKLKSNNFKNNIPLKEFLSQINLLKYFDNLDSNGFDDVNILIEEAKKGETIKDEELKEVGISCPGDRAKILIRIKEKANIFGFSVPKNVYHICQNLNNMNDDRCIKDLKKWLKTMKVEDYLMNFVNNGYHSIELLFLQMQIECPITQEILRDEIGIDLIGYRSRIINKLKEDGKNMYNMLKTKTLVVNNYVGDKKCDCYLF